MRISKYKLIPLLALSDVAGKWIEPFLYAAVTDGVSKGGRLLGP